MSFNNDHNIDQALNENYAVRVRDVNKCFHIYDKPHHRLLQGLMRGRKHYYKEFCALKNASFEIQKGQTVGIIGKNGAGKSTLLQILTGTLSPTSGEVNINGRVTALLELGAGFNPEFSGIDNIYINGAILGLSKKCIDEKLSEIIAFADIGDFINQPVKIYSSGMYVRLAFAIQANLEPDVFIIDEALAVGDANFVHKCMLRFQQLKDNGTTIILVTHDATAVRTLCDRAIWIESGEIRLDGRPEQVVDRYLASSRRQPLVELEKNAALPRINIDRDISVAPGVFENELPNIDQRYGDQACSIFGACLYDKESRKVDIVSNDSEIMLRISFMNNSLPESHPVMMGYSLRNHRGVDIASSNSEIEGVDISAPAIGSIKTVGIIIRLPLLHPGSFAFTVSINYRASDCGMNNADTLPNLIVFDIVSKKIIHVLMSLDTTYIVES